ALLCVQLRLSSHFTCQPESWDRALIRIGLRRPHGQPLVQLRGQLCALRLREVPVRLAHTPSCVLTSRARLSPLPRPGKTTVTGSYDNTFRLFQVSLAQPHTVFATKPSCTHLLEHDKLSCAHGDASCSRMT